MFNKITTCLLLAMITVGCEQTYKVDAPPSTELTYFKDARTDLCFARINSNNGHFGQVISIAEVPCEKVAAYLPK